MQFTSHQKWAPYFVLISCLDGMMDGSAIIGEFIKYLKKNLCAPWLQVSVQPGANVVAYCATALVLAVGVNLKIHDHHIQTVPYVLIFVFRRIYVK